MNWRHTLLMLTFSIPAGAQDHFNVWLSSCGHLIGPSGSEEALQIPLSQSRGLVAGSPAFSWDMMVDVGDWTASQHPPTREDGEWLARYLHKAFGNWRGRYFTLAGNHDGEARGWSPGAFTRHYVNPLGDPAHAASSRFIHQQRPDRPDFQQLLSYPGTRWDRYLIRSGNIIWVMLSDRNEFDTLAETRGDVTGRYQAGRGSAAGMPRGGYPSGAVTRDTFEWWKAVVEDPLFEEDIVITAHHLLPRNTTITTDDGEPGNYHGTSGSTGPKGQVGGQLYWIREYDEAGHEVRQYAQTRPFLDYLRDRPGAIAAWIGGHTHVDAPESVINGRGISVRKYGVTFISVGALTTSHAAGGNQMTRLLTFEDGSDEAVLNVYVHQSTDGHAIGWQGAVARRVLLGRRFECPTATTDLPAPVRTTELMAVPDAPVDRPGPRYYWDLDADRSYDFNNDSHVVGADGSPYGVFQGIGAPRYTSDSPSGEGRSIDLSGTSGRIHFGAPYQPAIDWPEMTLSCWLKTASNEPQEAVSYSAAGGVGKFRLRYDGSAWLFEVGDGNEWRSARVRNARNDGKKWRHYVAIADGAKDRIELYIDGALEADVPWAGVRLKPAPDHCFVIGGSGDPAAPGSEPSWTRPFAGKIDEVMIFDQVMTPDQVRSTGGIE